MLIIHHHRRFLYHVVPLSTVLSSPLTIHGIPTTKAGDETTRPKEGSCMSFFPLGEAGAAYESRADAGDAMPCETHGGLLSLFERIGDVKLVGHVDKQNRATGYSMVY